MSPKLVVAHPSYRPAEDGILPLQRMGWDIIIRWLLQVSGSSEVFAKPTERLQQTDLRGRLDDRCSGARQLEQAKIDKAASFRCAAGSNRPRHSH